MNTDLKIASLAPSVGSGISAPQAVAHVVGAGAEPHEVSTVPKMDPEQMRQHLKEAIEQLNAQMKNNGRELRFAMDPAINGPVVTVRNTTTGDLVRQFPNETVIRMAHDIEKLKGMLYNKAA